MSLVSDAPWPFRCGEPAQKSQIFNTTNKSSSNADFLMYLEERVFVSYHGFRLCLLHGNLFEVVSQV